LQIETYASAQLNLTEYFPICNHTVSFKSDVMEHYMREMLQAD